MNKVLYYTLAVCIFGWIGITAFLVISNALDPNHVPMPRRLERYEDYMNRVDSSNKYRMRPFVDSINPDTIVWRIENK